MDKEVSIPIAWAVMKVPSQAVEIKLTAKVFLVGEIKTVETTLDFDDVRQAISEAEDYFGPDEMFELTEKGKQYAKEMGWE